ncbi:uncharacterized protein EI90DRAFT_3146837 [Cantharellus anzutake]|uniref:uncharacterized protein n=1 Tax=Cantharellus anzutake TaxID=1750568 RepID=UPI0019043757|nr:uncharacterized protein EI90DRAFT_3146837 [Cantharellus anzutake]KAF8324605.1 hypothetical protein EI90DRAFT_3146837 [Cantharellus anzutake]
MLKLEAGIFLRVFRCQDKQLMHGHLHLCCSDLPASCAATGRMGCTSNEYMCTFCNATIGSLADPTGFDLNYLRPTSDSRLLRYSFMWSETENLDQREFLTRRSGKRWSPLDQLPGWMPSRDNPVDFMHSSLLGIVKHVSCEILLRGGMFIRKANQSNPLEKFESFIQNAILWPASVGRLPKNVRTMAYLAQALSGGRVKADEWRNLAAILFIALYASWQEDGMIPNEEAPLPSHQNLTVAKSMIAQAKLVQKRRQKFLASLNIARNQDGNNPSPPSPRRNYARHYNNVLKVWTQSGSISDYMRAHACLVQAFQDWAAMGCHLVPYCHIALHMLEGLRCNGPVYATWCFGPERHNRILANVNHNGHGAGELESTMARAWLKMQLLQELVRLLRT